MSFRFVTAGESHGPGLTAIVEGLPAGLELSPEQIDRDLARRQLGQSRGAASREPRLRQLGGADESVAG
jgi:chorismate synthase